MGSSAIQAVKPHRKEENEGYFHGQLYQKRMMRAHDKKIWPRQLQEGELVLKRILQNRQDPRGKWSPNWEGPYVVKRAFSGGVLILTEMDGKDFPGPINADIVKKYYAWGHQKKDLSDLKTRKGGFGKKKRVEGENPKEQFKP